MQDNRYLRFHHIDNEQLICYSKATEGGDNVVLTIVNLDPRRTQSGLTKLRMDELGLDVQDEFEVHDLLTDARYPWKGERNYIELNPLKLPAHIFRIERLKAIKGKNTRYKDSQQ